MTPTALTLAPEAQTPAVLTPAVVEAVLVAPAANETTGKAPDSTAARSLNDVRAAIASLDDSAAAHRPILRIPELKAAQTQLLKAHCLNAQP